MINRDVWIEAGRLAADGAAFCLAVVDSAHGSVPRRAGSAMVIRADGSTLGTLGGGQIERQAAEEGLAALADGHVRQRSFDLRDIEGDGICGGTLNVLLLPQAAPMALHLFGAGHVARPLCHLAAGTGYRVTVYDDSEAFATPENFPDAAARVHGDLPALAAELAFGERDAVVILTGSHALDLEILRALKDRRPPYLGVIASRKKAAQFRQRLIEDGWDQTAVDQVRMPVGLAIGSRTPAEIAVSIVAEMVQERGAVE